MLLHSSQCQTITMIMSTLAPTSCNPESTLQWVSDLTFVNFQAFSANSQLTKKKKAAELLLLFRGSGHGPPAKIQASDSSPITHRSYSSIVRTRNRRSWEQEAYARQSVKKHKEQKTYASTLFASALFETRAGYGSSASTIPHESAFSENSTTPAEMATRRDVGSKEASLPETEADADEPDRSQRNAHDPRQPTHSSPRNSKHQAPRACIPSRSRTSTKKCAQSNTILRARQCFNQRQKRHGRGNCQPRKKLRIPVQQRHRCKKYHPWKTRTI